jgi:hypothetical protein
MHHPYLHKGHSALRQGNSEISEISPVLKLIFEFFFMHQYVSIISRFDLILKKIMS